MLGVAASNNWAIAPQKPQRQEPAGQRHPPAAVHALGVELRAHPLAEISRPPASPIAGVPAVVAGFNGKLAWGMTMVMGDNQDLFLEQLKPRGRPPLLHGRRQMAAGPRAPGNLLHQGPAADPRNHLGNPPRPAAQLRPRRAQVTAATAAAAQRLRPCPAQTSRPRRIARSMPSSICPRAQSVEQAFEPPAKCGPWH